MWNSPYSVKQVPNKYRIQEQKLLGNEVYWIFILILMIVYYQSGIISSTQSTKQIYKQSDIEEPNDPSLTRIVQTL